MLLTRSLAFKQYIRMSNAISTPSIENLHNFITPIINHTLYLTAMRKQSQKKLQNGQAHMSPAFSTRITLVSRKKEKKQA